MQSGAQSTAPIGPTDSSWQEPYDLVLSLLGCDGSNSTVGTTNSSASGTGFECLKNTPGDELIAAQEAAINASNSAYVLPNSFLLSWSINGADDSRFIFAPSIDGDLIPASPHQLLEQGQFAKIPFISGSVKDEYVGRATSRFPYPIPPLDIDMF